MGRIIFDYAWISITITILLGLIAYFFPDFGGSGSAVTTVVSGMVTGQLLGQRTGQEVTSAFAWKVAAILTLVALLIAALIVIGFHFVGVPILPEGQPIGASGWVLILGISASIILLITRFSFRWGVKMGAKAAAQKKDKAEIFD